MLLIVLPTEADIVLPIRSSLDTEMIKFRRQRTSNVERERELEREKEREREINPIKVD